jgi:hypothetical protein
VAVLEPESSWIFPYVPTSILRSPSIAHPPWMSSGTAMPSRLATTRQVAVESQPVSILMVVDFPSALGPRKPKTGLEPRAG